MIDQQIVNTRLQKTHISKLNDFIFLQHVVQVNCIHTFNLTQGQIT